MLLSNNYYKSHLILSFHITKHEVECHIHDSVIMMSAHMKTKLFTTILNDCIMFAVLYLLIIIIMLEIGIKK